MASRTLRALIVAALLAPAGCIVGPQEDIPTQPPAGQDADVRDGDPEEFDLDGDDPMVVEHPDNGFAEGSDTDADAASPPGGKTIHEIVVPVGAPIPHGGWPQPRSDGPDFDASSSVPVPSSDFGDGDVDGSNDDPDC